jgi:hypothetical protein
MPALPPCKMSLKEKYLYHQIHPLKLFTDIGAAFGSLYPLWRHQLAFALVVMLAPPPLVSLLLMRYAELEPYRQSAFGKYIARSMSRAMQAVRLAGMLSAPRKATFAPQSTGGRPSSSSATTSTIRGFSRAGGPIAQHSARPFRYCRGTPQLPSFHSMAVA